jgi:hypothetical protein
MKEEPNCYISYTITSSPQLQLNFSLDITNDWEIREL